MEKLYRVVSKRWNPPYVAGDRLSFPLEEAAAYVRSGHFEIATTSVDDDDVSGAEELAAAVGAGEAPAEPEPPPETKPRGTKKKAAKKKASAKRGKR